MCHVLLQSKPRYKTVASPQYRTNWKGCFVSAQIDLFPLKVYMTCDMKLGSGNTSSSTPHLCWWLSSFWRPWAVRGGSVAWQTFRHSELEKEKSLAIPNSKSWSTWYSPLNLQAAERPTPSKPEANFFDQLVPPRNQGCAFIWGGGPFLDNFYIGKCFNALKPETCFSHETSRAALIIFYGWRIPAGMKSILHVGGKNIKNLRWLLFFSLEIIPAQRRARHPYNIMWAA